MGFLGLGNKDKKITEANNTNKKQIISMITGIQMNCKNADAITLFRNILTELQSQSETSKKEVIAIDEEIKSLLNDANKYIIKQQYPTVITKLNKVLADAVKRHQYCIAGGTMTKQDRVAAEKAAKLVGKMTSDTKVSRGDELLTQIDEKTAELDALKQEFENLKKLHEQAPSNPSINAQATTVLTKIKSLTTIINNLHIELGKENVDVSVSEVAKANEAMVKGRTFSAEQSEIYRAQIMSQNEQMKATQADTAAGIELLGIATTSTADPFAAETVAAAFDPLALDPFAVGTKSQAQTQYGAFNSSTIGSMDMANDIKRTAKAIQDSIDTYSDKIDDASDDLEDLNSQLRPLLERRETASASDCLVLDGKIDQLNAQRNGIVYKIKRFRQVVSQLNDKLSLVDKLSTQQDLATTNAKIEQLTNGKFTDYAGLSMFLNDSVKESNDQLEEISTAVNVAESEEILMNSAAGASAALSDAATIKDEHKYDALLKELTATPRKA